MQSAEPKEKQIEALEATIREKEKAAREAKATADAIDGAVFDLKAVNPNAIFNNDTRTTAEIARSIEDHEPFAPGMKTDSAFKPYRSAPRFKELLRRMNLEP